MPPEYNRAGKKRSLNLGNLFFLHGEKRTGERAKKERYSQVTEQIVSTIWVISERAEPIQKLKK
jgi:hypothetical protein